MTLSLQCPAEVEKPDSSPPRVLLVEDYEASVLVATTFLELFSYAYDVAGDGRIAIEKVTHGGPYCAVLMDVQMRDMNGFEATRLIRAREKSLRLPPVYIIGVTAHALTGDRERCLAAGMNDYLCKPYNPDALERKLALARQIS